jgi:hypothetical protein
MRASSGRNFKVRARHFALAIATLTVLLCTARTALGQMPCRYEVTFWPNMNCGFGPDPGLVKAVNNQGHVVGRWVSCGDPVHHTFIWTGGPTATILAIPTGYRSMEPEAMNDLDEIVGRLELPMGTPSPDRAFLRRADGQVIDLGLPPGANTAYATSINNRSEVAGYYNIPFVGYRPFIWKDGDWDLIDVPSGSEWGALDINDHGELALWQWGSQGFVWSSGTLQPMGLLPGGAQTMPFSISQNGNVVGRASTSEYDDLGFDFRAFLFDGKRLLNLGSLPGAIESLATANNNTVIVGSCSYENYGVAFDFVNGRMRALDELHLIPNLTIHWARAISETGVIVAHGLIGSQVYGVILTPVYAPFGDIDANCVVNVPDLLEVINSWGACDPDWFCPADLDGDGVVTKSDLLTVIQHWGEQG